PPTAPFRTTRVHPDVAISPDGSRIVYVTGPYGDRQLYIRSMNQLEAVLLRGAEGFSPFFSPDGDRVGFYANDNTLKKVSIHGGPAATICEVDGNPRGASWGADDTIVFATWTSKGLLTVPAVGGEPRHLTTVDQEGEEHWWPEILPGGQAVLFTITGGAIESAQVAVLSLETGDQKVLVPGGSNRHYSPTGHLVYGLEGVLWAVAFDLDRLEVSGEPVPVLENVMTKITGAANFSFSDDGSLVYIPGSVTEVERTLVWVDREGHEEPLAAEPGRYFHPRVSPDGSRVAMNFTDSGNENVWIYELARKTSSRLTFDPAVDRTPLWTLDGQRVVFGSGRDGGNWNLFWKAADGTGQADRLTTSPNRQAPFSFSPDGKRLVFHERNPETSRDIGVLSMEGEPTSTPLLQTQFDEGRPVISPDGRWMAYDSNESGWTEVFVRPFPKVEQAKWKISRDGGQSPVWGPRGRELFYRSGETMMVVRIKTQPTFTPGIPEVLFTGRYTYAVGRNYDISPDGQRFLMIKEGEQAEETPARDELIIVQNWFQELQRLVPTGE
ncbi:hypothetical protein MYX84_08650, partial [Acidobacteria bacterium AH-259-O06]|nr:hypothetical protein [Acidobacteria bacterium AH-259-O06]